MSDDPNVFAGAFVDRSGERRKDSDWLAEALASDRARFVPVWGEHCLVDGDPPGAALLTREQVAAFERDDNVVFLGLFRDQPAFAVAIDREIDTPFAEHGEFRDLRFLGTVLPPDEANLTAHARALVLWHNATLYCGKCGSASQPEAGGNMRRCCNPDCEQQIFPRTDPAIIVLVADGDRCVLGRQASWPEGRYSTIAGFVEPGESLEDAVRSLQASDTVFHAFDVGGLGNEAFDDTFRTTQSGKQGLAYIADGTNGTVTWNTNDLVPAMATRCMPVWHERC